MDDEFEALANGGEVDISSTSGKEADEKVDLVGFEDGQGDGASSVSEDDDDDDDVGDDDTADDDDDADADDTDADDGKSMMSGSSGSMVSSVGTKRSEPDTGFEQMASDAKTPSSAFPHGTGSSSYEHLSSEEIMTMKLDILHKINVLVQAGYLSSRRFSTDDNLSALECELNRLTTMENMQYGLNALRWMVIQGVSVTEAVNTNFKLTPLRLQGWSASVHRRSHTLDPILLQIYQQYGYAFQPGPFTKLGFALAFSAANTHLSNTMALNMEGNGGENSSGNGNANTTGMSSFFSMFNNGAAQSADRPPAPAPNFQAQQPDMSGP